MQRRLRIDRALREHGPGPIDSDDQDELIAAMARHSSESLALFRRILALCICAELLPLLLLARTAAQGAARAMACVGVLLSCVLALVNAVWDVAVVQPRLPRRLAPVASFGGVNTLNAVLIVQTALVLWRAGAGWRSSFILVLAGNCAAVAFAERWLQDTADRLGELRGLRYKFKSV